MPVSGDTLAEKSRSAEGVASLDISRAGSKISTLNIPSTMRAQKMIHLGSELLCIQDDPVTSFFVLGHQ